jgi:hypothetical protein
MTQPTNRERLAAMRLEGFKARPHPLFVRNRKKAAKRRRR